MLPAVFDFLNGPVRDLVTQIYEAVGYLGVALWVAIESVIIPIPSELVLPFAGFLVGDRATAMEPLTGQPWSFWLVVLAGTLGATVGALVAYGIGAWGGRPLIERWGRYLGITAADLDKADAFFEQHGQAAAFFGRMVPVIRSLVSFAAGVATDAARSVHPVHVPRLAAVDRAARVRRRPARRELGDRRSRAQALRVRGARRARSSIVVAWIWFRIVKPRRAARARPDRRPASRRRSSSSSGGRDRPEVPVEQQVVDDLQAARDVERQRRVAAPRPRATADIDGEIAAPSVRAMPVTPAAAERSSGSTTAIMYDWRVGTSIWLSANRASSTHDRQRQRRHQRHEHQQDVRRQVREDHRVDQADARGDARGRRAPTRAARTFAPKKIGRARPGSTPKRQVEPVGDQALRDEPAGEGVEREQRRQPEHHRHATDRARAGGAIAVVGAGLDGGLDRRAEASDDSAAMSRPIDA